MPEYSKLLDFNPQLGLMNDLYQDSKNPFRESSVSNYLQIAIADVFANCADTSAFSLEIEARLNTDLLRTALSPQRSNFLLAMNVDGINTALDLTQDFGSVSHFLAQSIRQVDSLKVDVDRCRLVKERCKDLDNILHVSEDLDRIQLPANHYDLIVIGELELLGLNAEELGLLITRASKALSESGTLLVIARNPSRISLWFDAQEKNTPDKTPFENLYRPHPNELNAEELTTLFEHAGIQHSEHYLSYSSPQSMSNLFSARYLQNDPNALNHFYRLGFIDNPALNEYLLSEKLINNTAEIIGAATSNVFTCAKTSLTSQSLFDLDFAHFPGRGRKPKWRSLTARKPGDQIVTKTAIYPQVDKGLESSPTSAEPVLSQDLSPQSYQHGRVLVAWWLHALLDKDFNALSDLVHDYESWLEERFTDTDFKQIAYDLLPFNILVANEECRRENFIEIDTEWHIQDGVTKEFVLFRTLFWFAFENKALIGPIADKNNFPTLALFIKRFLPTSDLYQLALQEENIQRQIDNNFRANSVSQSLSQTFDHQQKHETKLECQLQWSDIEGNTDNANAKILEWNSQSDPSRLQLELPAWDEQRPILRLDPIASRGIFRLNSMTIYNANSSVLFSLTSFDEINSFAESANIQIDQDQKTFLAINDDPYFCFDLSSVAELSTAHRCEIELQLLHDAAYDSQLEAMSDAIDAQSGVIAGQASRLNEYRAEMEFLQRRLRDLTQHRTDLHDILTQTRTEQRREANRVNLRFKFIEELESEKRRTIRHMNQQLAHLNDQLVAQINHNQEMDRYLMLRPTTRLKRLVTRIIRRLLGKSPPAEEPNEPVDDANNAVEEVPGSLDAAQKSPEQHDELIGQNLEDYQLWVKQNTLSAEDIAEAKKTIESWDYTPVFSILVPIYNTDPDYLLPMIRSVQAQIYPYWQLCLVDDCSPKKYLRTLLEVEAAKDDRICLQFNEKNRGIALTSNDALAMATGDYIALLDHDDELSIDALYENAKVIQQQRGVGLIYSDEDKMDMQGNRLEPFFKPDYSPDLLDTNNYICHFTVIDKKVAERIGGFREGLDGSQDHDIILRAVAESQHVVHIPKILYHWRKIPGSTAVEYDSKSYAWEAGRQAVEDCLQKKDPSAIVDFGSLKGTYRVFREIRGNPLVSIIIPFKDKPELLDACIGSILARTHYQNFEIVGVSNNSEEQETFARMKHFQQADERVRFVEKNIPFNFSAICNYGVQQARGDFVILLNNDVEVEQADWLERLLEHAQRGEVGAVGGKLLFPDGRIQHAGIVVGMVGAAGHPHKFFPDTHIGYHGRLHMVYNVSAVTGAMLMVRKDKYLEVGGLDEDNLAVAYNDVDLCLKLLDKGYINVFTPHARAIHHESISRGYEDTEEKLTRLKTEQSYFLQKWQSFLEAGDPYYNPNLSLDNEHFSLNFSD